MNLRFRSVATVAILLVALISAAPAVQADPVVITGGVIAQVNGQDLPGFHLSGSNSDFNGILPIGGVPCCFFNAGDTVTLNFGFPLNSLPMQPQTQVVNGIVYPNVFVSGGISFTTAPFVAPPPAGNGFSFNTTFTAQGTISGYAKFQSSDAPLFSVPLVGSGIATVSGAAHSFDPNYVGQNVSYQFQANAAATPEPASLLLLGSGAAAVAFAARRRRHDCSPRG
jgi:hypothetical protein